MAKFRRAVGVLMIHKFRLGFLTSLDLLLSSHLHFVKQCIYIGLKDPDTPNIPNLGFSPGRQAALRMLPLIRHDIDWRTLLS